MLSRILIHSKNFYIFLKWVFYEYDDFKVFLESQGYYSILFCRVWLWGKDSKYFKVFNDRGEPFFLKVKRSENIKCESLILKKMSSNSSNSYNFYPKIYDSNIGCFSYNIYEDIKGVHIKKFSGDKINIINQIIRILKVFRSKNIVHRDVRPHNIVIANGVLKLLDYEHCALDNKTIIKDANLNKEYRTSEFVWDDAFSFKKIVDQYLADNQVIKSQAYKKLNSMVGEYEYIEK